MNTCDFTIPEEVVSKIEEKLEGKKVVYIVAIDQAGKDTPLIIKGVKQKKVSQPLFTNKFLTSCLSFCCFIENCEQTLSDDVFNYIDKRLEIKQNFILVFDNNGGVTTFKRIETDKSYSYSSEIKSQCIFFGVLEGSCCFYYGVGNGQYTPPYCFDLPPGFPCPEGFTTV